MQPSGNGPGNRREAVCYPEGMDPDQQRPQHPESPPAPPGQGPDTGPAGRAGPLVVARAVLGSFLGIRKARDLDADARSITPVQAIIGGLIGAAILIASLIGLVMFVTRG